jgi:acyl-CoA thioester hydrolase
MSSDRQHPDFNWTVRVYYEDTDAGGVVFYANYLKFFERARTEWLRRTGVSQHALANSHRAIFVVKSTTVDYHSPAKLDDELKLSVVVERLGRASVVFRQEAWRMDESGQSLLATGAIKVGCVDAVSFRPTPIPDDVLMKLTRSD